MRAGLLFFLSILMVFFIVPSGAQAGVIFNLNFTETVFQNNSVFNYSNQTNNVGTDYAEYVYNIPSERAIFVSGKAGSYYGHIFLNLISNDYPPLNLSAGDLEFNFSMQVPNKTQIDYTDCSGFGFWIGNDTDSSNGQSAGQGYSLTNVGDNLTLRMCFSATDVRVLESVEIDMNKTRHISVKMNDTGIIEVFVDANTSSIINVTNTTFINGLQQYMSFKTGLSKTNNMKLWNLTIQVLDAPPAPDKDPPIISNFNLTSEGGCIAWRTDKSDACNTTDATPTVTFATDENADCAMSTEDLNFVNMNASNHSTTTAGIGSHILTLLLAGKLEPGSNNLYIACQDNSENSNQTGSLNTFLDVTEGGAGGGVGQNAYAVQTVHVVSYTGFNMTLSLNVSVINPSNETDLSSITVVPDAMFGGNQTVSVNANTTVQVNFTNLTTRGTGDVQFNVSGSVLHGNMSLTTNEIIFLNPIDPPHAYYKTGIVDCSLNPVHRESGVVFGNPLVITGSGGFVVESSLRASSFVRNSSCTVALNDSKLVMG